MQINVSKICVFSSWKWAKSINLTLSTGSSVTFWNLLQICQLASRLLWRYQVSSGWGAATGRPAGHFEPSVKNFSVQSTNIHNTSNILQCITLKQCIAWYMYWPAENSIFVSQWVSQWVGSFILAIFISYCCWRVDPSGPIWTHMDPCGLRWTQVDPGDNWFEPMYCSQNSTKLMCAKPPNFQS